MIGDLRPITTTDERYFLQAKLKSHIHDPNAPELVHFLFSPLTLIVEASHDSNPRERNAERTERK